MSLMNTDTKILNKKLGKPRQQHVKRSLHRDHEGFIPGMQGCFNPQRAIKKTHHMNRIKKQSHDRLKAEKPATK